jgi:hypothetical protein
VLVLVFFLVFLDLAVMLGVELAGFQGVMRRMGGVAGGHVGVMAREFGISFGVVVRRLAVMTGGVFVVVGGLGVMFARVVHGRHLSTLRGSGRGRCGLAPVGRG